LNATEFNEIAEARIAHCKKTLLEKGEEYSREGDRLHNFKSAAVMDDETPEQALWGMAKKHVISVRDMVKDVERGLIPSEKMLNEKITDWINYGLLLEGLLVERMRNQQNAPAPATDETIWFDFDDYVSPDNSLANIVKR
jgi:hypothetical protein